MLFGVFDFLTECGWHISMSQWNQTSGNRNCLFCLQNIVMLYAGPTWMLYDTRTPTAFRVNFDVIVSIFVGSLSFPFTYFVFLFLFNIRVGPRTLLVDELVLHWSRYSAWMFSNYSRLAPARHLWPIHVFMSFYHVHSPHFSLCTEKERQQKNSLRPHEMYPNIYTITAKHEIKYRHNDRK